MVYTPSLRSSPPPNQTFKNWTAATVTVVLKRPDGAPSDVLTIPSGEIRCAYYSNHRTKHVSANFNHQGQEFSLEYQQEYSIFLNPTTNSLGLVKGLAAICDKCLQNGNVSRFSFGKCQTCGNKTAARNLGEDAAVEGGKAVLGVILKSFFKR